MLIVKVGEEGNRCVAVSFLRGPLRHNIESNFTVGFATTLAQRILVLCTVIELGCSRELLASHLLDVLESAIVLQDDGCQGVVVMTPGKRR